MKDGYILLLFVLGIFLVFTISGQITGQAFLTKNVIKANSCDADGVCEMKVAYPENAQIKTYLTVGGNTNAQTNGISSEGKIYSKAGFLTDQDMQIRTYLTVGGSTNAQTNGIAAKGDILSEKLAGNGNAYLCVNNIGKLFRSNTPCI